MSTSYSCSFSSELVTYLLGEGTKEERNLMADHLLTCSSCQIDLEELQEAWNLIPSKLEEVEVPLDLKETIMNHIFQEEKDAKPPKPAKRFNQIYLYRLTAALIFLAFAGVTWNNMLLRNQLTEISNQSLLPAQVLQVFDLRSADPAANPAEGKAWLYQQGDTRQLVFQVHGLDDTTGTEAYQVWLIHDGERRSAGVFHVDDLGNGILTYELKETEERIDAIGISLEPDERGTQPRGRKVLGT